MTDETASAPHVLIVAHGTHSKLGLDVHHNLLAAIRANRPNSTFALCWLDVASPSLTEALRETSGPAVIVPVLLSIGYHVKRDIPAVIGDRPNTVQVSHLGPDARVVAAVFDRLRATPGWAPGNRTVLIGSGSSDPEARTELDHAARLLSGLTGAPVSIAQLSDSDPLAGAGPSDDIASYLIAPGFFADKLRGLAGQRRVSDPIGAHPLLAELVVDRLDESLPAV
jgi:sirohydrochlorin ferrochelatase